MNLADGEKARITIRRDFSLRKADAKIVKIARVAALGRQGASKEWRSCPVHED